MNLKTAAYWTATALFSLALAAGGVADVLLADPIRESMNLLGYPTYFAQILGGWKILGVLAILVPALPQLKQWAYAGFTFSLTGAALSHLAVGDLAGIAPPLLLLAMGAVSFALHHEVRNRSAALAAPTLARS